MRSVKELKNKLPKFDAYPLSVRQALLDIQFNLGDTKFQTEIYDARTKKWKPGWPKLIKAVEEQDWETAAKESHRKGISEGRNRRVADWFRESRK